MFKKMLAIGAIALFALTSTISAAGAAGVTLTGNTTTAMIVAPAAISPEEAADWQFIREEEKLAHDVYVTLYQKWGLRVFINISRSEQQHAETVAYLLDRFNISDTAASNDLGEFTDAKLQALYDQLVAQGSRSVAEALRVGAAIEEIDILDLQERLAKTDNTEIEQVYNNLLAGSENHLRAFISNLKARTGETYVPQYLSQAAYNAIVSASGSQGGRGGGWALASVAAGRNLAMR